MDELSKFQQLVVLAFHEPELLPFLGALVAAVFALHRPRDVHPAQLLDRVIADTVAEQVVPAVGEEPEGGGNMRPYG
ncbi:MAG: hypothetical protein M3Y09_13670 [Actinomycetota bacterium]|nr:hypothetical protein [Actinomycetota bacterium]